MSGVFDAGLQAERTLMAWRRTLLALAAGLALCIRWSWTWAPVSTVIGGVAGAAVIALLLGLSSARYRLVNRELISRKSRLPRSQWAVALTATASLTLGLTAALFVVRTVEG